MEPDKLNQVLDSEVGERHDAIFTDAIDPDEAVLGIHFIGDVAQPVLIFAEMLGDASDGGDVMNLVDMYDRATRAESAATDFRGRGVSPRATCLLAHHLKES